MTITVRLIEWQSGATDRAFTSSKLIVFAPTITSHSPKKLALNRGWTEHCETVKVAINNLFIRSIAVQRKRNSPLPIHKSPVRIFSRKRGSFPTPRAPSFDEGTKWWEFPFQKWDQTPPTFTWIANRYPSQTQFLTAADGFTNDPVFVNGYANIKMKSTTDR